MQSEEVRDYINKYPELRASITDQDFLAPDKDNGEEQKVNVIYL